MAEAHRTLRSVLLICLASDLGHSWKKAYAFGISLDDLTQNRYGLPAEGENQTKPSFFTVIENEGSKIFYRSH